MFIDYAKIELQAGNGGNGAVAFRREKYIDKGGPNGGDGGRGGNIIFETNPNLHTLQDIRYKKMYKAKNGQAGGSNNRTGKSGEDLIIEVPCGTIIKNLENQKLNLEKQISDLRRELENLQSIEKENESNDESIDNLEDILQPEPLDKIYVPLTGGEDSGIIEEGPIKTRSESEWQNWYNFGKGQGLSKEQVDHAINAFDLQDNDGSGEIELDEFFILMSK